MLTSVCSSIYIGVVTGLPTVGVAKNLHQLQELGPQFARDSVSSRLEQDSGRHVTLATAEVGHHTNHPYPSEVSMNLREVSLCLLLVESA